MIASVDRYLGRRFVRGSYDCLDFAREVWRDHTGEDIGERLHGALGPARVVEGRHLRAFRRLDSPRDPCLVLMKRPKAEPHIGVYLRGRVLHIQESGPEFQPLEVASRGFTALRFYDTRGTA